MKYFILEKETKHPSSFPDLITPDNMLSPSESEALGEFAVQLALSVYKLTPKETKLLLQEVLKPEKKTKLDLASTVKDKYKKTSRGVVKKHGCETGECTDCGECE